MSDSPNVWRQRIREHIAELENEKADAIRDEFRARYDWPGRSRYPEGTSHSLQIRIREIKKTIYNLRRLDALYAEQAREQREARLKEQQARATAILARLRREERRAAGRMIGNEEALARNGSPLSEFHAPWQLSWTPNGGLIPFSEMKIVPTNALSFGHDDQAWRKYLSYRGQA